MRSLLCTSLLVAVVAAACADDGICKPVDASADADLDADSAVVCADGCLIDGDCYPDGAVSGANVCQVCRAALSSKGWSAHDEAPCDDGLFCNGADRCGGGTCSVHAGDPCTGGDVCDDEANQCRAPTVPGCGDGFCDHDEDCFSCVPDCGACTAGCGDRTCEPLSGEACSNCPSDCACGEDTCLDAFDCARACGGDGVCIAGCVQSACYEGSSLAGALLACLAATCPEQCADLASAHCALCTYGFCSAEAEACQVAACGPPSCGDGTCQPEEDCVSCAADCGACPDRCGDGTCQPEESCGSCAGDCGVCCGNGACAPDESCSTCPVDCGECPHVCGDSLCEPFLGESCGSCPADCTCGDDTCGEVLTCFLLCTDPPCGDACVAAGCNAAQSQAVALLECVGTSCLLECQDPSDAACESCITSSCHDQYFACVIGMC